MLLELKAKVISEQFLKAQQKDGEYGFSIALLAALLSICASLYSLYKDCHEDDASYGTFRQARVSRRQDRQVKRIILKHIPDLDEDQLEELKKIILNTVKETTEEEYNQLTQELESL